jgi:hypothetical protein
MASQPLPSNGPCLQSHYLKRLLYNCLFRGHCLATDLHTTIYAYWGGGQKWPLKFRLQHSLSLSAVIFCPYLKLFVVIHKGRI